MHDDEQNLTKKFIREDGSQGLAVCYPMFHTYIGYKIYEIWTDTHNVSHQKLIAQDDTEEMWMDRYEFIKQLVKHKTEKKKKEEPEWNF